MSFNRPGSRSHSLNQPPPLAEKLTEDPVTSRTAQSTVTCVYMANIAGYWRRVTVTWCKNLMHHFFTMTVHGVDDGGGGEFLEHGSCKIDLKPWLFWSKKGYKSFELDSATVEVFWDIRAAKFASGPEPCSDFYVAAVCDGEVALLVGDSKKKAFKRTKSRPALAEAAMLCKRESVFAKRCFSTRARFGERRGKECDVVVETAAAGREPEMWISVDGIVVVHVRNLQWKFRGNQTVVVANQTVQVFWDVHDWMFGGGTPGAGRGLFVFKPGPAEAGESEDGSEGGTLYYSAPATAIHPPFGGNDHFCLFLHACKLE